MSVETSTAKPKRCNATIKANLAWLMLGLALFIPITAQRSLAEPYRPSGDQEILEQLPSVLRSADGAMRGLRSALRADPDNLSIAVLTAKRYMSLGRSEGDPRFYGYAQAALAPWWALAEPPSAVAVLRAIHRQSQHDFDGALTDLSRVLASNPNHTQAWLTRAVIYRAQGEYEMALESCRKLQSRSVLVFRVACVSATQSLNGEARKSYAQLDAALTRSTNLEPRVRLWSLTILGEVATRLGRLKIAEQHFEDALALGIKNAYLLGAYADLLLDQRRYGDVRTLLKDDLRADPLLLRFATAIASDGKDAQSYISDLGARFDTSRLRGETLHLREEARFLMTLRRMPEEALQLALRNWKTQREPWDARLVLEAALAANSKESAAPVLAWLAEKRLESAPLQKLIKQFEEGASNG